MNEEFKELTVVPEFFAGEKMKFDDESQFGIYFKDVNDDRVYRFCFQKRGAKNFSVFKNKIEIMVTEEIEKYIYPDVLKKYENYPEKIKIQNAFKMTCVVENYFNIVAIQSFKEITSYEQELLEKDLPKNEIVKPKKMRL